MTKEDMIYDSLKRLEEKQDKHLEECGKNGLTTKEWTILSGIITVVCGSITAVAKVVWG